ncbi:MAG: hypothetical protein OXU29_04795 [Gammaproteobacteria bacterium]|nr:hypothetical protein [Gammaproteobacteria bacterium]
MTTKNLIGNQPGDVNRLATEVAELKGILGDISQQVRRIERRVEAVLPSASNRPRKVRAVGGVLRAKKYPMTTETDARRLLTELEKDMRRGNSIEPVLRKMTVKNELTAIARALGMTNAKLPPKTELIGRIVTRLRQSIMLTENIDALAADKVAETKNP